MDSAEVTKIVTDKCYTLNEVVLRRIGWYSYKENTTLSVEDDRIVIKTEMPIKGMNLQEGATAKDRNSQVGGHKA